MPSLPVTPYGPLEELRAGLDWISCTLHSEAKNRWIWANDCVSAVLAVGKEGHDIREAGLMGYRGIAAGGCFAGDRDDGSYLQLSGAYAQRYLMGILRPDLHVSRMDLAVTCRFVVMPKQLGRAALNDASKAAESSINTNRPRKVYHMEGNDGGFTLYIGAPTSAQRGRLYNKEVQSDSNDFARCWRWEVVYKNALAMEVLKQVSQLQESAVPNYCSRLVGDWYELRGVSVPWAATGNDYVLPVVKTKPSDATKRLAWLETQVKPAIRWLIEHGYQAEICDAIEVDNITINGVSFKRNKGEV